MIILTHIAKLFAHCFNELINIIIFLFDSLNVLFILGFELINERLDENIFLFDNLLTSFFLNFDVPCKFFAVFLLFKFLPSPINLNILFVRCNNFSLNFVCSFLPHLLFLNPSLVLKIIGVCSDFGNDFIGSTSNLLQETLRFSDLDITMWLHFWRLCCFLLFLHV